MANEWLGRSRDGVDRHDSKIVAVGLAAVRTRTKRNGSGPKLPSDASLMIGCGVFVRAISLKWRPAVNRSSCGRCWSRLQQPDR